MHFFSLKTPLFCKGDDLFKFFCDALRKQDVQLSEKSVVIVSSKIVALSQGRVVQGTKKEIEKYVKQESEQYWKTNYPGIFLSLTNNILIANAGIDASNAKKGTLILWPENVQEESDNFCEKLKEKYTLNEAGVIITDSRCTPLRTGVTGIALAWSGFEGVLNEKGKEDLYGQKLEITQNAVADNLASASELIMGNANESTPFVICNNAPVEFTDTLQNPNMASFPPEDDLFSVFWN